MSKSFHLSLAVPDLDAAKSFYTSVLGCSLDRDSGSWVDVLFFGHQLTLHQAQESMAAVAVDHFGPILSKAEWILLSERIASHHVDFQLAPQSKNEGTHEESGKFIVKDPAGNSLEFKYYESC